MGKTIMGSRLTRALPVAALLTASLATPAAAAVIDGTSGPDVLIGTNGADTIRGFGGNDVLRGRRGADHLYGGRGADHIYGGGDRRPDVLYGRAGNDRLYVGTPDTVYAGRGNDVIIPLPKFVGMWGKLRVNCGPGYDRILGHSMWPIWLIPQPEVGYGKGGCEDLPID
jgi:hypothetical protein